MIRKVFNEKIEGLIWRLLIHEPKGLMAIESRDLNSKKAFFSVLNISSGEFLFKEKTFLEEANTYLVHISEENLLLKMSSNSESIENTGILSVNLFKKEIVWQKYQVDIQTINNGAVEIYDTKFYPRKYYWIDVKNGLNISEPSKDVISSNSLIFPELNFNFEFPEYIKANNLEGGVSELLLNGLNVISFHEKNGIKMNQKIIVYNGDSIVLEEILIGDIQKLQPESFFILKNQLFYIRNKNEIVSYFV